MQVLNAALAVGNALFPADERAGFDRLVTAASILATDGEYCDLRLTSRDWAPAEDYDAIQGFADALLAKCGGAVFEADDNQSLYERGSGEFGLLNQGGFSLSQVRSGSSVRVAKGELAFRLVQLRVPYAMMRYSVHVAFLDMGGYKGADEIDKCFLWLMLVSRTFPALV